MEQVIRSSGSYYRVTEGETIDDTGPDGAGEIVRYLYSLLVSEGGFREAVDPPDHMMLSVNER